MNDRKKNLAFFLIVFSVTMSIIPMNAHGVYTRITVESSANISSSRNGKSYYALGYLWMVVELSSVKDVTIYSSSDNGTTWNFAGKVGDTNSPHGFDGHFYRGSDGRYYCDLAWVEIVDDVGKEGKPIYYKRVRLTGSGNIAFDTPTQVSVSGDITDYYRSISITVDANKTAWIAYGMNDTSVWVTHNSKSDGYWSTYSSYNYEVAEFDSGIGIEPRLIGEHSVVLYRYSYSDDEIYSHSCTRLGVSAGVAITGGAGTEYWSISGLNSGNIYLVYREKTTNKLLIKKRNPDGSFDGAVQIGDGVTINTQCVPVMCYDEGSRSFYIYYGYSSIYVRGYNIDTDTVSNFELVMGSTHYFYRQAVKFSYFGNCGVASWDNTPSSICFAYDVESTTIYAPYLIDVGYTTDIYEESGTFYFEWDDLVELSNYTYSTNITGSWVNTTGVFDSTPDWINSSYTLDGSVLILGYRTWAENIYGNITDSGECFLYVILPQSEYNGFNISIGNNGYLFEGELYDISINSSYSERGYLQLSDGYDVWRYQFVNDTNSAFINITSETSDIDKQFIVNMIKSTMIRTHEYTFITWRFMLGMNIVDSYNLSISYYIENNFNNVSGLTGTYVNIYNLGGQVQYSIEGNASRIIGGDAFDIGVLDSNDVITASAIYRRLQHVHILPEWFFNNSISGFNLNIYADMELTFGMDYTFSNTSEWVTGWKCKLQTVGGEVGNDGIGTDGSWIKIWVGWYNQDIFIKSDYIYANHYGYDPATSSFTPRKSTQLWVDLWFNKLNASTVVGGRVNSYYNGMREDGWFLWADWSPMIGNITSSMFFDNLLNSGGNIETSRNIELVKFYTTLEKKTDDTDNIFTYVHNYEIFNWKIADDRMMGVDTPIFVEPKNIDTPQQGFLAPLYKAIESIGSFFWGGMLGGLKTLIGAMDSLLSFIGSPVSMSAMIEWVMIQASVISSWMIYVTEYALSMITVFTSMLTLMLQVIENTVNTMLWIFGTVIAFPLHIMNFIIAIINGETYTISGWVFDFTSASELIDGARIIAPLALGFGYVSWIFWGNIDMTGEIDEGGIAKRILLTFQYMREGYNSIFWVFNRMRNEIISLYNFIRSHIPSIGGSGGETTE